MSAARSDRFAGMPAELNASALAGTLVVGPGSSGRARMKMARAASWLYAAGGSTLLLVLLLPADAGQPDRLALALCAAACGVIAGALRLVRSLPTWIVHLLCPGATTLITMVLWAADPVTVAPSFYVLPLTLAAYFLPRLEVIANLALTGGAYLLALELWIESTAVAQEFITVAGVAGTASFVIFMLREQMRGVVAHLQTMASFDALTGALNRAAFEQRLEEELERTARTGRPCAVALLDIDRFKGINDAYGHAAGDEALRCLSETVHSCKRRSDVFGRIGGEEFSMILPDTDIEGAEAFAEHLRAHIASRRLGAVGGLTVSIGVAAAATPTGVRAILGAADRALYEAKAAGRDRVARAAGEDRARHAREPVDEVA